jgi:hypothetical protein
MDQLRAGESMNTASAKVTNQGAGMYYFQPLELTPEQRAEKEAAFNAWIEKFNAAYEQHFGKPSSAYLLHKGEAVVNGCKD